MDTKAHPQPSRHASAEHPAALHEQHDAPEMTPEEQLAAASERVQTVIRQNPGSCLLGAAAIGFLAGAWASRR